MTRTVVEDHGSVKTLVEGIHADGTSFVYSFTINYDGADSSVVGIGMPGDADAIAVKRINARKHESIWKRGGKAVVKTESDVSGDGKITTVIRDGKTPDGKKYHTELVYDKQ
jgi:hypothetical protein